MKPGTVIRLPDGRIGTICWNHLDGQGGVWGEADLSAAIADMDGNGGFSDLFPEPEFMLREKTLEALLRKHHPGVECVGMEYEIMEGDDAINY